MLIEKIEEKINQLLSGYIEREEVSLWAMNIINCFDHNNEHIDKEIFEFLIFLSGYDTPDFDRDYLFNENDLLREFNKINNIL